MITGLFQPDSGDITLDNASLLPIATENTRRCNGLPKLFIISLYEC